MFRASDIGQQLADRDECPGRCIVASAKFESALEHCGAVGTTIEFHNSVEHWHHHATALCGVSELTPDTLMVDWTARQFASEVKAPYPRIETIGDAVRRWGPISPVDAWRPYTGLPSDNYFAGPWSTAQQRAEPRPEPPIGEG